MSIVRRRSVQAWSVNCRNELTKFVIFSLRLTPAAQTPTPREIHLLVIYADIMQIYECRQKDCVRFRNSYSIIICELL